MINLTGRVVEQFGRAPGPVVLHATNGLNMQSAKDVARAPLWSDLRILLLLACPRLLLGLLFNGNYGFHRDELDTLDNTRYLAWGYVAYPPLTPFVTRLGLEAFGPSLLGLRMLPTLAQAGAMVLVGLMAREMGGGRWAQVVATIAAASAPVAMTCGVHVALPVV